MVKVPRIYLLIASFFDEAAVVRCVSELRGQRCAVSLVGLTIGLVNGSRGIAIQPELTVAQMDQKVDENSYIVILAGGVKTATLLLTDPRVHQLIRVVLESDGIFASMAQTYQPIHDSGAVLPEYLEQWVQQGKMETAVFVKQLFNKYQERIV